MADLTIVYYTANTEPPDFEARIRTHLLLAARGLPIISVSRCPMVFGTNVCVGPRHVCDANAFRQLLIGATLATTPWIAVAEADAVYPPAYFEFDPPQGRIDGEVYRYTNVWILGGVGGFKKKEWTEGAQIVSRERLIAALTDTLRDRPEWSGPDDPKPRDVFKKRSWQSWARDDQPMISCKTGHGLRAVTGTIRSVDPVDALPYWGRADALRAWLFDGRASHQ